MRYNRTQCPQQGEDFEGCNICEGGIPTDDKCPFVYDGFNDDVTPEILHLMSPEEKMCDMRARMNGSE